MAEKNYKSVIDLFRESREAVAQNLQVFILINILSILSVAWLIGTNIHDHVNGKSWGSVITGSIFGSGSSYPKIGGGIIMVVLAIIGVALALMKVVLSVRVAQGKQVSFGEVWDEFKQKALRLVLVELLVGFIIVVGLVALILPGIYLIGRVALAPYILINEDTKVFEAVERSWHLTRDRMWQVYTVLVFGVILSLPGIIPVIGPIISLALTIAYSVATPMRYLELKNHRRSPTLKTEK